MPNRYGENETDPGYPQPDTAPDVDRITSYAAIDACDLCDSNGIMGNGWQVCDHYDYGAAAKRGKALCEAELRKGKL